MAIPEDGSLVKVVKLAESLREELRDSTDDSEIAKEIAGAVHVLVQSPCKVYDVSASDLAVCLWVAAWLRDAQPEVLEVLPMLVASIPGKAGSLCAQELSDCMWEVAWLKDAAPEVLEILPAVAVQIPAKAHELKDADDAFLWLWAAWELKDAAPDLLEVVNDKLARHPSAVDLIVPNVADLMDELSQVWWEELVPQALKTQVMDAVVELAPRAAVDMSASDLCACISNGRLLLDMMSFSGSDCGRLQDIMPALAAEIPKKAYCMEAGDLGRVLRGVAELHCKVPEMLEALPSIMAQIQGKVEAMKAAKLGSCCIEAAWRLHHEAPYLLKMVTEILDALPTLSLLGSWSRSVPAWFIDTAMAAILPQISGLVADMEAADLANCLVAVAELKDVSPEVLPIAARLIPRIPGLACQKVRVH